MSAIDTLLARLPAARAAGHNRWRDACPVCGGSNRSALSIGVGDTGAVLLKCFKSECAPEAIALALGLDIADLFPPRESQCQPAKKRRLLSAQQALNLLHDEVQRVALVAVSIGHGDEIDAVDRASVLQAAGRIAYLRDEVMA